LDAAEVRAVLAFLDPANVDHFFKCFLFLTGAATTGSLSRDDAFNLFAEFAARDAASYDAGEIWDTRTWGDGRIGFGSMIRLAKVAGYAPEKKKKWRATTEAAADDAADDARPEITIRRGALPQIVDAAEAALRKALVPIYQRSGELVRVVRLDSDTSEDAPIRRRAGALILKPVTPTWLHEQFARVARWQKFDVRARHALPADPDPLYAVTYLARVGEWCMPVLRGVIEAPTLREDFSILQTPGYDRDSQLLFAAEIPFPAVPEKPTRADAAAALQKLVHVLRAFPFVPDERTEEWRPAADEGLKPSVARSIVLSAMLTALIRRSLPSAPLFVFDAPLAGSGKTMLAEIVGIIATGRKPPSMNQGRDAEEDEKRLGATLREGDPVLLLDNCSRDLDGDLLCSMITQENVAFRILGLSQMMTVSTRITLLATGNNATVAGDLRRRALVARVDPVVERPDEREFEFSALEEARAGRANLVVAGLTILRAYIAAKRPLAKTVRPIGSFEDWNVVREALIWLQQPDPAARRGALLMRDPKTIQAIAVMSAWHEAKIGRVSVGKLVSDLEDTLATTRATGATTEALRRLHDALAAACPQGRLSPLSLGKWFVRNADRVVGGRCFVATVLGSAEPEYELKVVEQMRK
jgi:hypothetical protein